MLCGMTQGAVILLNGTSSAGKTTLAAQLRADLASDGECWIVIGIDDYLGKLPPEWHHIGDHVGPYSDDGFTFDLDVPGGVRIGGVGARLLAAYRSAVRGAVLAGINVIVDEAAIEVDAAAAWSDGLAGLDVYRVGVDAEDTVKAEREASRGDRLAGLARAQHDRVHAGMRYDLTVDTGRVDPRTAAEQVRAGRAADRPA